jgi:hypothetical protein
MEKLLYKLDGREVTFGGEAHSGWLPAEAAVPLPTPLGRVTLNLAIVEAAPGSFFLRWTEPAGRLAGDTWHPSEAEAFEQAELNFGIARAEWSTT